MSGGEPSSIKQKPSCAAELPILSLKCEERPGVRFRIVRVRSCGALNESVWDFVSPIYEKAGSSRNLLSIPERRRPRRLSRGIKSQAHVLILMKTAWRFSVQMAHGAQERRWRRAFAPASLWCVCGAFCPQAQQKLRKGIAIGRVSGIIPRRPQTFADVMGSSISRIRSARSSSPDG